MRSIINIIIVLSSRQTFQINCSTRAPSELQDEHKTFSIIIWRSIGEFIWYIGHYSNLTTIAKNRLIIYSVAIHGSLLYLKPAASFPILQHFKKKNYFTGMNSFEISWGYVIVLALRQNWGLYSILTEFSCAIELCSSCVDLMYYDF